MIRDIDEVRRLLREKVLAGKDPSRDMDSAEDYWIYWMVLDEIEFETIKREAMKERNLVAKNEKNLAMAA